MFSSFNVYVKIGIHNFYIYSQRPIIITVDFFFFTIKYKSKLFTIVKTAVPIVCHTIIVRSI